MQYLIVRTVRISTRNKGESPVIESDGAVENIVVESNTFADAVAWGLLGNVMDGGDSMRLTQFTVLNIIPMEDCTREEGKTINILAQGGGGLSAADRDRWDKMGLPGKPS